MTELSCPQTLHSLAMGSSLAGLTAPVMLLMKEPGSLGLLAAMGLLRTPAILLRGARGLAGLRTGLGIILLTGEFTAMGLARPLTIPPRPRSPVTP